MSGIGKEKPMAAWRSGSFRNLLAYGLGIRQERKAEIYIELSKSAMLRDASYWLQVLFSSGIATLGLVLDSPAVIIGAMLISPLMGPILANGLAIASGDLILGLRAIIKLALSCFVAVCFATLLVGLLPFKEVTAEIAARTRPNTLDLVVALFSGAVGSVAVCKEVKGVATSIPGVAIAVALMPPLCIIGYGAGVAVSLNAAEGIRIANGGGLLFLTNLVAITLTAMIIFFTLHMDAEIVKKRVKEWRKEDTESALFRNLLMRHPALERLRNIGGIRGRFLSIVIIILIILIPLSQSLSQLRREIVQKQQENQVRQVVTSLWQEYFASLPDGEPRSYIGQLSSSEIDGKLTLRLSVFTARPYTDDEKIEYRRLVAASLARPAESISLQLVEVPTTSSEILTRAIEGKTVEATPTVAQLQASMFQGMESAIEGLELPEPARLIDYEMVMSASRPLSIRLIYLSGRNIDKDGQTLIAKYIRRRLGYTTAMVSMERVESSFGPLAFGRNKATLTAADLGLLDRAIETLQRWPELIAEIQTGTGEGERQNLARERAQTIMDYLTSSGQIASGRIAVASGAHSERNAMIEIKPAKPES